MSEMALNMSVLPGIYAVCRLDGGSGVPEWAMSGGFFSVTRTADELSLVCPQGGVPDGVRCERDWRCLKVQGPLDFGLTGILASLAIPLAEAGISIFSLSTYDSDYIMVKTADLEGAIVALSAAGHTISQ